MILDSLNPKQREAVVQTEGPLLILAGAGSGKTKTLTHRVAYLIQEKRVPAGSVMAVTFTNKASQEMRERIADILHMPTMAHFSPQFFHPRVPAIGTFHSICSKILRREIEVTGRDRNFHILDTSEQLTLIKKIVKHLGLDPKQFAPRSFLSMISSAKNKEMSAKRFRSQAEGYVEEIASNIYEAYEKALLENEALDFDDLLLVTVKIFEEYPGILEKYQRQFRYILVDEYQDTNHIQYRLITMLSAKHRNLCVVGDDWQSIYAFRGADIRNILEFEKDFPDAKIVHLEQNYRSTQIILDAAHGIISQNTSRKDKKLWTESDRGEKLIAYESEDETQEARYVSEAIESLAQNGVSYEQCAVLYRTNAQSRAVEESLLDHDIPYKIVGGVKFYERKEIKDIIAYMRLVINGADRLALSRIVNEPKRSIGEKTLDAWLSHADGMGSTPMEVGIVLEDGLVAPSKKKAIAVFCEMIHRLADEREGKTLAEWVAHVYRESGYENMLSTSATTENEARRENIGELIGALKRYDKVDIHDALTLFLEEVALVSDSDDIKKNNNVVNCMTMHSAKGLEFEHVFIVGLEENILPHSRAALSVADLEEERRLMYVGVTRAKKHAHLVYARHRMLFGNVQANPPSRFLDEIPSQLIERKEDEYEGVGVYGHLSPLEAQSRLKENQKEKRQGGFGDGDHVTHSSFGSGVVVSQDEDTYTIIFQKAGMKKIAKDAEVLQGV